MKRHVIAFGLLTLWAVSARADFLVRIGDKDGFGYNEARGFRAAKGGPANVDRAGILGDGDFLPDINRNGVLATGNGDDFDLRSASEIAGDAIETGAGVITAAGTQGSNFTDIALSTSYGASSRQGKVLIGGNPIDGLQFGAGGPFPSPPSNELPNQPGFVFRFEVDKAALAPTSAIFFNLVFGDFDVLPAEIQIKGPNHAEEIIGVQRQGKYQDGLIQNATATLSFDSVFTDGGSVWIGAINVNFRAPKEPYTAFDYVELSTIPLVNPVPEPSGLLLLGAGCVGLIGCARRRAARGRAAH